MQTEISKKYSFLFEHNKIASQLNDPIFIFNEESYLSLWPGEFVSSCLINTSTDEVAGFCNFQCVGNAALSPFQAPFASIYQQEEIRFEIILKYIRLMTNQLNQMGYNRIYLKHYPDFYSHLSSDKLITALFFDGFQIKQTDINHYLKVSSLPFEKIAHPMQRRRIKKCLQDEYKFHYHSNKELDIVFRKIQDFRMQKNIPVNINSHALQMLFDRFPNRYHLFSVSDGDRTVAATCMVSVNKKTLYNFLPASDPDYSSTSPMVFLMKNIYEYAQSNHYRFIDLGVSSIKNQPQSGLISFKENLGGIPGVKFQLEKITDPSHV